MATKIYRGATIRGTIQLRSKTSQLSGAENPYVLPVANLIELKFPGETATVVLSTAVVGEVSIVSATLSTITFEMSPTKSLLLAVGNGAALDAYVTNTATSEVDIFEALKVFDIVDPKNT